MIWKGCSNINDDTMEDAEAPRITFVKNNENGLQILPGLLLCVLLRRSFYFCGGSLQLPAVQASASAVHAWVPLDWWPSAKVQKIKSWQGEAPESICFFLGCFSRYFPRGGFRIFHGIIVYIAAALLCHTLLETYLWFLPRSSIIFFSALTCAVPVPSASQYPPLLPLRRLVDREPRWLQCYIGNVIIIL